MSLQTQPQSAVLIPKPLVLVVDNSKDDLFLMERASRRMAFAVQWKFVEQGSEAISYILGKGQYSDRNLHPLPMLVLLDIKMPKVSGFDVLASLAEAKTPKPPYICILTTSNQEVDLRKAMDWGADVFHAKPADYNDLCDLLERLVTFFCLNRAE